MSFQNKGFLMGKGSGHINDRETAFGNPTKIEPKRPHQWFVDAAEVDFFPNKKRAAEDAIGKSSSGFSNANFSPWENNPNFHPVPNISHLFGSETRPVNFSEKNTSYAPGDDSNVRSKMVNNQYGVDASFGLSISHSVENSEAYLNFEGIKKVKTNEVKDSDGIRSLEGRDSNRQSNGDLHLAFNKDGDVALMGLTYNSGEARIRSFGTPYSRGDDPVISIDSYNKEDPDIISFGGFSDERDITSVARSTVDYGQFYNQSSVHVSTIAHEEEIDASNSHAVVSTPQTAKVRSETVSKSKQESKPARKEAPNSFPSNVRSLISTGILDGVPVKYVSVSREELGGIIKGSGYLCGCQSCNYSKVLNAYELERHAGCKTKHPNNHIYFENGKTIYQVVQELKSTPQSLLFDTIQTVFGAPINQKAFRNWKESFQAATRELQRIYGKEELNL